MQKSQKMKKKWQTLIQGVISGVFPNFISVTGGFLIMVGVIILAFQDEFMLYLDIFAKIIKEKLKSNEQHRADEYDSLVDACPWTEHEFCKLKLIKWKNAVNIDIFMS